MNLTVLQEGGTIDITTLVNWTTLMVPEEEMEAMNLIFELEHILSFPN